ncbi:hypothetical protein SAMN02745119_01699 [Trichlorobacter thiogenes]|uniref:Uncharacterized protein n=2 Tax=Trichlorobacter thiogenes TaxID=115783 RepID=A0A1T4NMM3_9BACT|nr:hypothetical protein SAMN02745119_01699 [Trichlorobacter thiogenes]
MRWFVPTVLIFCLMVAPCFADEKTTTVVKDEPAKAKLLGPHKLSLQWISWDNFGTATAVEKDGLITIKGEQRAKTGGDYVLLDGVVTEIGKNSFKINGSIVTKVSYINRGEACVRQGDLTFRITGSRKYWRLKEMDSPCGPETDYVDIYFRK